MKTVIAKFILFIALVSCQGEQKQQKKSDQDLILDRISKGDKVSPSDINKLLDNTKGKKGSYKIENQKAKFEITFPVLNIKKHSTKQIIDEEEIEIFHYTANMQGKKDDNLGYQLDYMFLDYIKSEDDINELYNQQRDYLLSVTNGELELEEIIKQNNVTGRHLYFTVDNSAIKTSYRMFYKNGLFYKLTVITNDGHLFNKSISKFFNSFKITK